MLKIFSLIFETIFNLYISFFWARFLLQCVKGTFTNPMVQSIIKITNPILVPVRRHVPAIAGVDTASLLVLLGLNLLRTLLFAEIGLLPPMNPLAIMLYTLSSAANQCMTFYLVGVLFLAVLSWTNPMGIQHNALGWLLHEICSPLLQFFQRLLPPIAGIDFSPVLFFLSYSIFKIILKTILDFVTHHALHPGFFEKFF